MLNKKIADMLNEQVNKELYSAYLYLDFANYYEDEGLTALPIGTKFRRRRSATMRLCSAAIS